MKLKITSYHLVVIIIVQVILIDGLLAAFFFKQSSAANSGLTGVKYVFSDPLLELVEKTRLPDGELKVYKIPDAPGQKMEFIATAYDLSYKSCGKYPSHPEYGITFSGIKAVKGRTIAVDPDVIPLGSMIYVEFPGEYSYMDGLYIAEDTGSKVKGNIIDIFLGESAFHEIEKFGSRNVLVKVLYPGVAGKK